MSTTSDNHEHKLPRDPELERAEGMDRGKDIENAIAVAVRERDFGPRFTWKFLGLSVSILAITFTVFGTFIGHVKDTTSENQHQNDRLDKLEREAVPDTSHQQVLDDLKEKERRLTRLEEQMDRISQQHVVMMTQNGEIQAALKTIREMLVAHEKETRHFQKEMFVLPKQVPQQNMTNMPLLEFPILEDLITLGKGNN